MPRVDRGQSPALDQIALSALIESGRYDRHLRHVRLTYSRRRKMLLDAIAAHAPRVTVTGIAAGFHAVAHPPAPVDEQQLVTAARLRSVGLYGMSGQRWNAETTPTQLVLGYGNVSEHSIQPAIAAVADLLDSGLRPR